MKTSELMDRLRARYSGNAYALITEVGNGTGMNCNRHCDALVMSLWPSRGLELIGCELKVSRADWQKELKQPEKAEDICGYCDRWYIVAADSKIVQPGELPPTWGLLVANGTGLKAVTEAPRLEAKRMDRVMLAAIFRRVNEQTADVTTIKAAVEAAKKEEREYCENSHKYHCEEHAKLQKRVADFQRASGVDINAYWPEAKEIGKAVRTVIRGEHIPQLKQLEQIRAIASSIVSELDRDLEKPEAA